MASLFPTESEKESLRTLEEVCKFTEVPNQVWAAVGSTLGSGLGLRTIAMIPAAVLRDAIMQARISKSSGADSEVAPADRELNAVETVMVCHTWRVCRHLLGQPDEDPLAPSPAAPPAHAAHVPHVVVPVPPMAASNVPVPKRLKCATVIDQGDETEVRPLSATQLEAFFANHVKVTGV